MLRAKEAEISSLKEQLQQLSLARDSSVTTDRDAALQLQESIGELQARRDRLQSHLSELNGEILSSTSVSGGAPPSRSRMRRRVSDFMSKGDGVDEMRGRRVVSTALPTVREAATSSAIEVEMLEAVKSQTQGLKRELEEARREAQKLRRELDAERHAADAARQNLDSERDCRSALEQELASMRKSEALRKLALPTPAQITTPTEMNRTGSLKEYRIDPATSEPVAFASPRKSRDKEQVERLEKIIEGQHTIITTLKDNVKLWRDRTVEQGRLIESMLVEDHMSTPKTPKREPVTPTRPPSSSATTRFLSPRSENSQHASSPQRFLYFRHSPKPLPVPEYMDSPTRTRRRVTIERDLDKLQKEQKVARTHWA